MSSLKSSQALGPTIAVIGAGAGGLALAIALKQQLGHENFIVYEKASGVGGTWRDNVYPGCSSDVGMHFYSLSTDLRDWSHSHGAQEDILRYWRQLTEKYNLYPHIAFDHKVISANWNTEISAYEIVTENAVTGERKTSSANILISAVGILETPRFADIPGVADFKGELFHSARWNKDADLRGKRVAVIGNGASATQFVPIISEDPAVNITQFCRTPNWYLPPIRVEYSPFRRWLTRNIPFIKRFFRLAVYLRSEIVYFSIFSGNRFLADAIMKAGRTYITQNAPKKYRDVLLPLYPIGCKRIVFDTNYLGALHRPNLELNWDGIESICEDGIVTRKTGEKIPFDVLIFATGYAADRYPLPVRGLNGKSIQQHYEETRGPTAYLGTAIPGFPNFFTILGPNTGTGHTSVIFTNEVQVNYIIQLIKPILQRKVDSLEVKSSATDAYNAKLQAKLSRSVFVNCISWYRVGGEGKVTNIFPGAATLFWWWLRKPNFDHYNATGAKGRLHNSSWLTLLRRAFILMLAVAIGARSFGLRFPLLSERIMQFTQFFLTGEK